MALLIGVAVTTTAWGQQSPKPPLDEYGDLDTVTIEILPSGGDQWQAVVSLTNDESVAAITLPLICTPGFSSYRLDSASYTDLRTAYFALKTFFPDTTRSTILIGLISDLGAGLPPLEPGSGPIARLFFTAMDGATGSLGVDTTFIRPHNVLQLVTPDARAILPALDARKALAPTNERH